ncbi:MAG: alpha/beta hydrolase [Cyclobacteriaceae bacterium]
MSINKFLLVSLFTLMLITCKAQQSFISFDGTKISYTDKGTGPVVLLIHGFIVDGTSWGKSELKKQLLNQGYRVVIPDLRGNGSSDKPQQASAYENNAELKDLIALMDHLDVENCRAVGYSRGSILLAKLLTMDDRITQAVIGGMGIDFTDPDWDRRIEFANAFSGRAAPNEMTEGAVNYAKSVHADLRILGYLQDYQPVTSIAELNDIRTPTLVISGEDDLDNGNPADLQKQIPNSRLSIVSGDHSSTIKSKEFAEAILYFLITVRRQPKLYRLPI